MIQASGKYRIETGERWCWWGGGWGQWGYLCRRIWKVEACVKLRGLLPEWFKFATLAKHLTVDALVVKQVRYNVKFWADVNSKMVWHNSYLYTDMNYLLLSIYIYCESSAVNPATLSLSLSGERTLTPSWKTCCELQVAAIWPILIKFIHFKGNHMIFNTTWKVECVKLGWFSMGKSCKSYPIIHQC